MKKFLQLMAVAALAAGSTAPAEQATEANTVTTPEQNPTIQTIMARRSVRQFTAQPIGRDTLQLIMTAGINAPSAMNRQDWEVRMVDNQATLNELSDLILEGEMGKAMKDRLGEGKNAFSNAAAVAFVAAENNSDQAGAFSQIDAALLGENMLLSAQALGIGTVFQGGPVAMINSSEGAKEYIKKFGFSENYELLYIILLGHPAESPDAKPRDASKAIFVD